jgi:hypothetical protein
MKELQDCENLRFANSPRKIANARGQRTRSVLKRRFDDRTHLTAGRKRSESAERTHGA